MIVFDLDGTLANCEHRVHHLNGLSEKSANQRYRDFYADCINDEVIAAGMIAWTAFIQSGLDVCIVTGRSDEVRAETVAWLVKHDFLYEYDDADSLLFMRPESDHRPDTEVKPELLARAEDYFSNKAALIFEDRNSMVKLWRSRGIPCYQVAEGDF